MNIDITIEGWRGHGGQREVGGVARARTALRFVEFRIK